MRVPAQPQIAACSIPTCIHDPAPLTRSALPPPVAPFLPSLLVPSNDSKSFRSANPSVRQHTVMQSLRLLGRQASASAPRRFTAFAYGGARPMSSASAAVPEEPEEPPAKEEATVAAPEPTKGAAHVLNSRLKPKEVRTPCAVRRAPALRPRRPRATSTPRRRRAALWTTSAHTHALDGLSLYVL